MKHGERRENERKGSHRKRTRRKGTERDGRRECEGKTEKEGKKTRRWKGKRNEENEGMEWKVGLAGHRVPNLADNRLVADIHCRVELSQQLIKGGLPCSGP